MATRNAQKKAEERRISTIGDFKNRIGGIQELPSGLSVQFRNPGGLQAFMGNGTIPNSLMPLVKQALKDGDAPKPEDMLGADGEVDADLLADMVKMYDSVAMACIVKPRVHPVPTDSDVAAWNREHPEDPVEDPEDLRSDEKLYIDELPFDDKQFLLMLVTGGVKDLETFLQQSEQDVANVASIQGNVRAAQLAAGLDPR